MFWRKRKQLRIHGVRGGDIIIVNGVQMNVTKATSPTSLTVGPLPWWKRLVRWLTSPIRR